MVMVMVGITIFLIITHDGNVSTTGNDNDSNNNDDNNDYIIYNKVIMIIKTITVMIMIMIMAMIIIPLDIKVSRHKGSLRLYLNTSLFDPMHCGQLLVHWVSLLLDARPVKIW